VAAAATSLAFPALGFGSGAPEAQPGVAAEPCDVPAAE
jgi:hypothetical protein